MCLSWYTKLKVNIRRSTTSNLFKASLFVQLHRENVISLNSLSPEKRFVVVLKLTSIYVNSLFDNLQKLANFDMLKFSNLAPTLRGIKQRDHIEFAKKNIK